MSEVEEVGEVDEGPGEFEGVLEYYREDGEVLKFLREEPIEDARRRFSLMTSRLWWDGFNASKDKIEEEHQIVIDYLMAMLHKRHDKAIEILSGVFVKNDPRLTNRMSRIVKEIVGVKP